MRKPARTPPLETQRARNAARFLKSAPRNSRSQAGRGSLALLALDGNGSGLSHWSGMRMG